jgi:hypothetical protein
MASIGLQPAYKPPKVKTPDDSSILTLLNALVTRANDMYTLTTALSGDQVHIDPLMATNVNQKNARQCIATLNYLHDVIAYKLKNIMNAKNP